VFVWKKNIKGKEKNIQMAIIHRSVSVTTSLRLYNRVRVKCMCTRVYGVRMCVCVCFCKRKKESNGRN